MHNLQKFYINGEWVEPQGSEVLDVLNPATDAVVSQIRLGNLNDAEAAVAAAVAAFESFSQTSREERIALLERIVEGYSARLEGLSFSDHRRDGGTYWFLSPDAGYGGAGAYQSCSECTEENRLH